MKVHRGILATALVAGMACGASAQVTYNDAIGDIFDPGLTNLDIVSVTLNNDLANFYVDIAVVGDISSATGTDWGKYLMLIDTDGGATGNTGNGWGRAIDPGRDSNFFVGSWVDGGGGGEIYMATGSDPGDWMLTDATWDPPARISVDLSDAASGIVRWVIGMDAIGNPAVGSTIFFDVMTTGGSTNDPGVDHLSRDDLATPDWGTPSVAGPFLQYTIIPAPGAAALLALGAMVAARRRRA